MGNMKFYCGSFTLILHFSFIYELLMIMNSQHGSFNYQPVNWLFSIFPDMFERQEVFALRTRSSVGLVVLANTGGHFNFREKMLFLTLLQWANQWAMGILYQLLSLL
jgi:hypothetical protein